MISSNYNKTNERANKECVHPKGYLLILDGLYGKLYKEYIDLNSLSEITELPTVVRGKLGPPILSREVELEFPFSPKTMSTYTLLTKEEALQRLKAVGDRKLLQFRTRLESMDEAVYMVAGIGREVTTLDLQLYYGFWKGKPRTLQESKRPFYVI